MRKQFRVLPMLCALAALNLWWVCQASAQQYWQLTFGYNQQTISLLRAAQMPPLTKAVRTPGLEGAALRLDFQLEWLDEQGAIVATTAAVIPLGGHSVLAEDGVGRGPDLSVPPEGVFVLRVPGPSAVGVASQVRLRRGLEANLAVPGVPGPRTPPPFLAAEHTLLLPEAAVAAAPGPISATKVRNTGPDANRFVIAILGDGFTAADLARGSFSSKVVSFQSALFATSPWNNYASLVNVYRVDIESAESGADYADAGPDAGGTLKETYLDGGFWVGGTERCCYLRGSGVSRAMAAADDLVGVGVWDEILVFVNSTKYGGCGGAVGVSSINSSSDEIQIHEFGHSFGALADEYDYGSTSTNCFPSSARNIDCPDNFPMVKWQVWVTPGAPIPTPDTTQYASTVGAFEGAGYQVQGIFRPMRDCKMRTLGVAFCPVCKEGHILKLFERVRMADSAEPALGVAEVPSYGTRSFRIFSVNVAGLSYQWYTNGVPIPNATNVSVVLAGSQVTGTNFELRLETTHSTPLVRAESIANSSVWTVRALPLPALAVGNASVIEGNSGATNLIFPVTLSFGHTGAVQVAFSTLDGTASAGSDYRATNGLLTFTPGQLTNFVRVPVFGDTATEPDEVLFLSLSNAVQASIRRKQGVGVVLDRDQPPVLLMTSPGEGAAFAAPAHIPVTVDASDPDGSISRVEFFRDAVKIGERTQEPFSLVWSNVAAGNYILTAIATDNSGKQATSGPVNVYVQAGLAQNFALLSLTNLWRYDATTNDLGTAWKERGYDDSAWAGPSRALLHNEPDPVPGPKNTQVPLSYNGARIRSFYFRTHFTYPTNPGPGLVLTSSNLIDDGAVFWLNGAEVARIRMPAGAVVRTTLANASPPAGDATAFDVLVLPATNLMAGDNVMAVEVHQQGTNSSDVVFGMSLDAVQGFAPTITDPTQPTNRTVMQGHSTSLAVNAVASPPPYYLWYRNGLLVSASTNSSYTIASMTSGQAGNYYARITNAAGSITSRVAVVTYQADSIAPSLVYALASTNSTRVTVSFSENPNSADAITVANYRLSGGGSNLLIISAAQQGTNVLLTTAPRVPGLNYVLTVNNVRDSSGNVLPAGSSIPVASEVVLVAADRSNWNYFQSDRDPGIGWAVPGFEVSSDWGFGPALFDAKRPAGRTTVGPNNEPVRTMLNLQNPADALDQTTTYYFRTVFTLPGPAAGTRLRLRTLVDDGAVFYLNGLELHRLRMDPVPASISYTNFATTSRGDNENVFEGPFDLPTSALRDGENVLAVEVHQVTSGSSDMSFAAQLIGEVPMLGFASLRLTVSPAPNGFYLQWDQATAVLEEAPAVNGTFSPVGPQATSPYLVTPGAGTRFFRLRSE